MTFPLEIRRIAANEVAMVLSDWKKDIDDGRRETYGPLSGLVDRDFWSITNYVIDKITFPTSTIYIGVHPDAPDTPVCWAAVRDSKLLHVRARRRVLKDPELAVVVQKELLSRLPEPAEQVRLNLFMELRR
jgi:hypothetical protein